VAAVEVKTRHGEDPADQVTAQKRRRMREAAAGLSPPPQRIDLVTVRVDAPGVTVRWIRGVI
jgi:Holliday junction resolvase-like predicted endonuclease